MNYQAQNEERRLQELEVKEQRDLEQRQVVELVSELR
jgi:hypothetical protein